MTLQDVLSVARRHKISPNGYLPNQSEPHDVPTPGADWIDGHVPMVEACRLFLCAADRPWYRGAQSSYFLKHEVERWTKAIGDHVYVTNGAFLVACYLEGLNPRRIRSPLSPNGMISVPHP